MPFKALLRVLEHVKGAPVNIKVRKSFEEGFVDISGAALKKVRKLYDLNLKKAQKAAEKSIADAEKNAKQAEEEAARIEESKKIVLKPDLSLPAPIRVNLV